ncbi:hypothetical protein ACM66Z_03280 [Sulfurovum sp. ST-21]|uniref:Uncharacterized protein n=1 Tax=Sulfurovum indicum TaxID=2779528 RepID=A0A7M1S5Z1_9BACT|nr:hypothetical protein [Sulfurovum indicum]QOR62502.1 hypothetical protein IMZ28_03260 [Sulfurovum indicum]
MKEVEKFFDINMVLMTIYSALEQVREEEKIELVYDIDSTIPKELRGDAASVTHILTQLLMFVFQNTHKHEVILSLYAPKDFLYEEFITFAIDNTGISREKALSFFDARLKPLLDRLDATASYAEETERISISVPFKLQDLGNRRYYRLPDIGMLGKNVLLICKSKIISESLQKMFKYFLYEVDVGAQAYKERGSNLAHYDLFVLEDSLLTEGIEELVQKVQQKHDLKLVILQDADNAKVMNKKYLSAYLVKPVMQESIYELIISLFEEDVKERKIKREPEKPIINMEKYIIDAFKKSEEAYVSMEKVKSELKPSVLSPARKQDTVQVLNVAAGEKKMKKAGVDYAKELEKFIETFDHSDVYFRDIAKSKAAWQIKEFAIDLEKNANLIGAERIAQLAEKISLLFVYDNLDMLPVYTGKYHVELTKLLSEIRSYLKKRK